MPLLNFWDLSLAPNIFAQTIDYRSVVLKLGSTEPQGFGEAIAGVRPRSE